MTDKPEFPESSDPRTPVEKEEERLEQVEEHVRLAAPTVYEIVSRDGIEEMERPLSSLWWSGIAAGFGISLSLFVMAALRVELAGAPGAHALEKFGYCVGFLIVVLGRFQLFTENTITPVLPVLRSGTLEAFNCLARLWVVVFLANLTGTFLTASLATFTPMISAEQLAAAIEISEHFAQRSVFSALVTAVPAGFLVAAMVWMLPSSGGFEFWTIVAITFAIAIADTSHVIVGSTELFVLLLHNKIGPVDVLLQLAATCIGNVIGGTGLFAILAYAQVKEEI